MQDPILRQLARSETAIEWTSPGRVQDQERSGQLKPAQHRARWLEVTLSMLTKMLVLTTIILGCAVGASSQPPTLAQEVATQQADISVNVNVDGPMPTLTGILRTTDVIVRGVIGRVEAHLSSDGRDVSPRTSCWTRRWRLRLVIHGLKERQVRRLLRWFSMAVPCGSTAGMRAFSTTTWPSLSPTWTSSFFFAMQQVSTKPAEEASRSLKCGTTTLLHSFGGLANTRRLLGQTSTPSLRIWCDASSICQRSRPVARTTFSVQAFADCRLYTPISRLYVRNNYSALRASLGSTRAALRAGT